MAVPGILLTLEGVKKVADRGQELNLMGISITSSNEDIIEKILEKMEQYIEQAEITEKRILEIFGINTTDIKEGQQILQQKFIDTFEKTKLIGLSGPQLRINILNAYEAKKKAENDEFEQWVQTKFKERVLEESKKIVRENLDYDTLMSLAIIEALKQREGESGLKLEKVVKGSSSGKAERGLLYKAGVIITKELNSEHRKGNLKKLYEADTGKTTSVNPTSKTLVKEEKQDKLSESLEIETDVDYFGATGGRRASDLSKLSPEQREKELEIIRNLLKQEIAKCLTGEYNLLAYKILEKMLKDHVENFLVGDNVSDITGILGEFRTAVALSILLRDTDPNAIVDWVAKRKVDNIRQLSADFILQASNGLNIGIQVKNSAQDLDNLKKEYEIHFADANINSILDKLGNKYPIFKKGSKDRTITKLIYISSSFNVPYKGKWENGKLTYINGETAGNTTNTKNKKIYIEEFDGYEDFCQTRDNIKDIKEKIDLFLKMFSPDFLFMATDDSFKNALATLDTEAAKIIQGNNLYIIGNKPFFVSTILRDIINGLYQLEVKASANAIIEKQKLIDDGFLVDKGKETFEGGNIVDYLNEFSTAEGGVDWKKIRKVSKNQNYQMTSSLLLS